MFDNNNILLISVTALTTVVHHHRCENISSRTQDDSLNKGQAEVKYSEEVGHCLRDGGGVGSCLAASAFVFLEAASHRRSFLLSDDLEFQQENELDTQEIRSHFLDRDPTDFHSLLDASTKFLQRRTLKWNLEYLYPGLQLCLGPTQEGPPILQFLLDPRHGADERRLSTSRLLIKRTLLPYILGMKLNLVAVMPIVFAALIFLTKKAFLLSKFAFLFMTMMGFNVVSHYTHHHVTNPSYPSTGYGFNSHDYYQQPYKRGDKNGKNFAWEERERKMS